MFLNFIPKYVFPTFYAIVNTLVLLVVLSIKRKEKKVKLLSHVQFFAIPWSIAYQSPPSVELFRQEKFLV